MGLQCDKNDILYKFFFQEKVDLFPERKTYKTGDTIWVEYINPDQKLYDKASGQRIAIDTVSVDFEIGITPWYYNPVTDPPDGFCEFIIPAGIQSSRTLGPYGTSLFAWLGCGTNSYNIKIGLVLKYKGIYSLGLPDERYVNRCASRITDFPSSVIGYRFNMTDGNKDIYLSIPSFARGESIKGYTENRIADKQTFFFQVE